MRPLQITISECHLAGVTCVVIILSDAGHRNGLRSTIRGSGRRYCGHDGTYIDHTMRSRRDIGNPGGERN